tara:strand:- start:1015 stop:1179 length:165 start_codon:yes stop_codon:yes gene_type:complete
MKYIVETEKSVDQAEADLSAAVQRHKFGVLHTYDLQDTMRKMFAVSAYGPDLRL